MAKCSSPTGRTWRPRSTSAVFGYWKPQIWTMRWRGRARAPKRAVQRSRCERFSLSRPPQITERYGNSELVLRSGVFETRLATDLNNEERQVSRGDRPLHAEERPLRQKSPISGENIMRENKVGTIVIKSFALLVGLGTAYQTMVYQAMAQDATTPYPKMAPIEQYLMDRTAEITLARSAAPASISRAATILVLGWQGYETAVQGKSGFVCGVGRGGGAAFDWAEFWNPKVKAADCLNPQAARSILPILYLRARMVMAGRSPAEIVSAVKAAFEDKQLPDLESGAMDYMMSKSSYLTDQGGHNIPHLMFYTRVKEGKDWGSGAAGSPVVSSPYWFFSPKQQSQMKGLPPILVFLVGVADWSDGTSAGQHNE